MAAKNSIIGIDPKEKLIHLYIMNGNDKNQIRHVSSPYKAKVFDDGFFKEYEAILKTFASDYQVTGAVVVLPDIMVFMDTIQTPAMSATAAKQSVQVKINTLYKNEKALKYSTYITNQNKQVMTWGIVGIQRDILTRFSGAGAAAGVSAVNFTFASSATICAASMINSKLKNASYMFMDAKENSTRVIIVSKGKVVGFSTLPFGYDILAKQKPVAEDMLFDHQVAELAVLNAREKAKAKALTMSAADAANSALEQAGEGEEGAEGDEENSFSNYDSQQFTRPQEPVAIKTLPRKQARKLPKYMLRPTPNTIEGVQAENFRIFEKWALSFLDANDKLVSLSQPEAVYINMPSDYAELFNVANEEQEENGIKFVALENAKEPQEVTENMEFYGAYFINKFSTSISL